MAKKVNGEGVGRAETEWKGPPSSIIVKDENRGRQFRPTDEAIMKLARSILAHGQIEPVICTRDEQDRLELVAGFTRWAAIQLIRDGFEYEGETFHCPDHLIKISIIDGNPLDSLLRNIAENNDRCATSIIDDVHNQRKLRDRYNKSDKDIAAIYACSIAHVQRIARLIRLSDEHQRMVHDGTMTISAAFDLLDRPEPERKAIVAAATVGDKVDTSKVRGAVRESVIKDHHLANEHVPDAPRALQPAVKFRPLSSREALSFFAAEAIQEGKAAKFARTVEKWMKGEITTGDFKAIWDKSHGQ